MIHEINYYFLYLFTLYIYLPVFLKLFVNEYLILYISVSCCLVVVIYLGDCRVKE